LRGNESGSPVQEWKSNPRILEVHRFHQLMQGNVCVVSRYAGQGGNRNSNKGGQRLSPEAGEPEIEPDHVWLAFTNSPHQPKRVFETVECPAAGNVKPFQFRLYGSVIVRQNRNFQSRNGLQLTRYMKPVFIERFPAGGKRRDQADFHC
jgi:hypothetical protein